MKKINSPAGAGAVDPNNPPPAAGAGAVDPNKPPPVVGAAAGAIILLP